MSERSVENTQIELAVSRHASIMLAWRYGVIANEGTRITAFCKKVIEIDVPSGKQEALYAISGANRCRLVVGNDSATVVTALPSSSLFNTPDANAIAYMLDILWSERQENLELAWVLEIRERYIDSNGRYTKDEFRRDVASLRGAASDVDHATRLSDEFLEEVRQLRYAYQSLFDDFRWLSWQADEAGLQVTTRSDTKLASGELERYVNLGKSDLTLMHDEVEGYWDTIYEEMNEYWTAMEESGELDRLYQEVMSGMEETERETPVHQILSQLSYATIGAPAERRLITTRENSAIYAIDGVTLIHKDLGNQWNNLYFKHNGEMYVLNTRFESILDSYGLGAGTVFVRDYGDRLYLESPSDYEP